MATVFCAIDSAEPELSVPLSELLETSSHVLYPDSSMISYSAIANNNSGIGKLSEKRVSVAIVGAGVAGLACAYELSKLVRNDNISLNITIYEQDKDNIIFRDDMRLTTAGRLRSKAGRVYAETVSIGDQSYNLEIGAMRIPKTACLTWNYVSKVVDSKDTSISSFPNPGVVPTQFVLNNERIMFQYDSWSYGSTSDLVRSSVNKIYNHMFGSVRYGVVSMFPIGRFSPETAKLLLISESRDQNLLNLFPAEWSVFIKIYDKYSLRLAITEVIENIIEDLEEPPDVTAYCNSRVLEQLSLCDHDKQNVLHRNKIRYFLDIIAGFGFGTGGFGSLYDTSFVDFMRLYLWGYNNEFYLPFDTNAELLARIHTKTKNMNSRITEINTTVMSVRKTADQLYVVNTKKDTDETVTSRHYDYVICAVPPSSLSKFVSNIDDGTLSTDAKYCYDVLAFAADHLTMLSSSKLFCVVKNDGLNIGEPAKIRPAGGGVDDTREVHATAVLSCDGLGSTYRMSEGIESKHTILLYSYTWSDDSSKLQYLSDTYPSSDKYKEVVDAIRCRNVTRHWLADSINNCECAYNYNWTAATSAGGFKLDKPVQEFYSNYCSKFYRLAIIDQVNVFVAGDSYSHHGGWIEGALISAINAVAGIIVASSRKMTPLRNPELALNGEARKLIRSYG